jgi:signal transduction histidine kinase
VSRRILFMLLAFTALVLVGAVVPLTLNATSHDRSSFIAATAGMTRTDAVLAYAQLDLLAVPAVTQTGQAPVTPYTNYASYAVLAMAREARQAGYGLLVLTSHYQVVGHGAGMPPGNWDRLAQQAEQQGETAILEGQPVDPLPEITGSYVVEAMPVFSQGGQSGTWVGTVILASPTGPLNNEIFNLWVTLGSIAAVAMIAAALLAFGLARWVSRPLKGLDAAARRLADGDLASRAEVGSGPPELLRLGTTFNTMAGRLEALVHGNRAVIADVSHQLRTPLAALRLRLDLLAADTAHSDPDTGHELAGALDELARLSRLVDGLLAVARAENVVPVPITVDAAEVARERVVAWHPVADDRSIVLVTSAGGGGGPGGGPGGARGAGRSSSSSGAGPALAWIGEGHLEQILDNLIANALEALSPGNMVRLTTTATASGARITVADNGPGMSADDRARAFLRFTTSSPNGTGLGLAIVHRLAISNGGTARLDETPGGGLTVTLDFPGVPVPNNSASANSAAAPAPASSASVQQDAVSL